MNLCIWTNYAVFTIENSSSVKRWTCCGVNTCLVVIGLSVFFVFCCNDNKKALRGEITDLYQAFKSHQMQFFMWISPKAAYCLVIWMTVTKDERALALEAASGLCWLALLLITVNNQHVAALGSPGVGKNIFIWPCWRSRSRCHLFVHRYWLEQHHSEAFNVTFWL